MKKINIFVFVLVFAFAGLFHTASAIVTPNNTFWNGEELVPIDWNGSASYGDDDDDDNNNNGDDEVTTLSATSVDEDSARLRGEVTNGNNVDVWFVIDDNDSTPSCSDDDLQYNVSGDYDDGDQFSRIVSGLDSDETYYFRACTDDDSGSVRSFTTDDDSHNNDDDNNHSSSSSADSLVAITQNATGVTTTSAYLNGYAVINEGGSGTAWFEYGPTTSLGLRTPDQSIGTGESSVSRQLVNLAPQTSYFFRFVIENDEGVDRGDIKAVTTNRVVSSTNTNTSTTQTSTSTTTSSVVSTTFLGLDISANADTVRVGDLFMYTVEFKNVSGKELKNIIMNVELPQEVAFRSASLGDYSSSAHSLFVGVAALPKGAHGTFTITVSVTKAARNASILVAKLTGIHDHPSVADAKVDSTSYAITEVDHDGNENLSANSFFAGTFFPTSFIGWLLIIFIIFLIILIARKIIRDNEARKEENQEIKIAK